jgi:hypothetical protein
LVFMRGKLDHGDFTQDMRFGLYLHSASDLTWSRWQWNEQQQTIAISANPSVRLFQNNRAWNVGGFNYIWKWFATQPDPRRAAGAGPTVLDSNAWAIPGTALLPENVGDYTDLTQRATALVSRCSACDIELVLHDGSTARAASNGGNIAASGDGAFVDGGGNGGAVPRHRARLLRLKFTMIDSKTRLNETFSFSVQAPNLAQPR